MRPPREARFLRARLSPLRKTARSRVSGSDSLVEGSEELARHAGSRLTIFGGSGNDTLTGGDGIGHCQRPEHRSCGDREPDH